MKAIYIITAALLLSSSLAHANVHKWKNTEFQTYSDKTQVEVFTGKPLHQTSGLLPAD